MLFDDPQRNSLASPAAHGIVFLNTAHGTSEVFFVEDLAHQCGHVISTSASLGPDPFLSYVPDTPLGTLIGDDDHRSIEVALHGMVTLTLIVGTLHRLLQSQAPIDREEATGRLLFATVRLGLDLRVLAPLPIHRRRDAAAARAHRGVPVGRRDVRPAADRLAPVADDATADAVWERCVGLVEARLAAIDDSTPWTSFGPMQFLRDNRGRVADADLVDVIWAKRIDPFVTALYDGRPKRAAREAFAELRTLLPASDPGQTRRAVAQLTADGLLHPGSSESLAVAACRYCLDAGADHVVVGMRRAGYVDTLAPLFRSTNCGAR